MPHYIGVDLHTTCFTACVMTKQGESSFQEYKLDELEKFKKSLRGADQVAIEATTNARFFHDQIIGRVKRVVVVNPRQFEVIKRSVKKTDQRDAFNLAQFLRLDLLPEVRMKDETQSQLHSLCQTRQKLVEQRTGLMNKLHNLCVAHGLKEKREAFASEKGLVEVLQREVWSAIEQVEVEVLVAQIRSLNEGIKRLEGEIKQQGAKLEGHDSLTSIKGIGPKAASILLSVIGKIEDFDTEGQLASYFGIVPTVKQSNETLHLGKISKQGSKLGRTTLVQCTLVAKKYSPYLKQYYERIKARRGAGKAIIATARKFLGIIFQTLKNKWVFEDFPNFVLAE